MNSPQKSLCALFLALSAAFAPLPAAEPDGKWTAPSNDGRPWKHAPTQLSFPPLLADYRFAGHFEYKDGGALLRYENLDEQARMDIFLFKVDPAPVSLEDQHRRILSEMDLVTQDLEQMAKQGRYKNLNLGKLEGGNLELWQKQSIPLATRTITASRLSASDRGSEEAVIRQWVGITLVDGYLLTMRHMRPAATGEAGEEAMKRLVGYVFQVIKDPSLQSHIRGLVAAYLADPFSVHGEQAAAAVLAYLKQTPYFPINIPENPVSGWMTHCKTVAPGTEEKLLGAFMLGSAKAAFADGDAETCLKEGSLQFAKIYRILVAQHPQITRPDMELFVTAAEKGQGAAWFKERGFVRP